MSMCPVVPRSSVISRMRSRGFSPRPDRFLSALIVLAAQVFCVSHARAADWAIPTTAWAGRPLVFTDNFDGVALDPGKWGRYHGVPTSDPTSYWHPSHVVVGNGLLSIENYRDARYGGRWTGGGVNNGRSFQMKTGRVEIRMRADRAHGISLAALLWPTANTWPPEIDFMEDRDGNRTDYTGTLHFGTAASHEQVLRTNTLDVTRWHRYAVEWGNNVVTFYVDGVQWGRIAHSGVPETIPMSLAIQSNANSHRMRPDSTTPVLARVQVDWVAIWS